MDWGRDSCAQGFGACSEWVRITVNGACVCAHYVVRYRPDTPCCGSELAISSHHHPNRLRPVSLFWPCCHERQGQTYSSDGLFTPFWGGTHGWGWRCGHGRVFFYPELSDLVFISTANGVQIASQFELNVKCQIQLILISYRFWRPLEFTLKVCVSVPDA